MNMKKKTSFNQCSAKLESKQWNTAADKIKIEKFHSTFAIYSEHTRFALCY